MSDETHVLELTKAEAAILAAGLLTLIAFSEGDKPDAVEALQVKLDRIMTPEDK